MRGDRSVIDRIKKHPPADLFLSTITLAEILYGIEKSSVKKKERRLKINQITSVLGICAFDEAAAVEYAVIRTYASNPDTWAYPPTFVRAIIQRENINELIRDNGFVWGV
jgi:predicted nucleic acid-binding protein